MSAKPIDELVVGLFFEAMAPAQVEIAMRTVEKLEQERTELKTQWEDQLTRAHYEAQLAQRQYDAVDPDNRLVAGELERRWNEKLEAVQTLEKAYRDALQEAHFSVSTQEAAAMQRLARDLPAVWHSSTTTDRERKQLLRLVVEEVQLDGVTTAGKIDIRVTWRSGAVTQRQIDRPKVGAWAPKTDNKVIERVRELSRTHTAAQIAAALDAQGLRSAHGKAFREHHVLYLAHRYRITVTKVADRLPL